MKIGNLFLGLNWCYGAKEEAVVASWALKCGYWRWAVRWRKSKKALCLPAFGPSMAAGTKYCVGHGHFGAWARLPLLGSFSISTQSPYPRQVTP